MGVSELVRMIKNRGEKTQKFRVATEQEKRKKLIQEKNSTRLGRGGCGLDLWDRPPNPPILELMGFPFARKTYFVQ